jgi:hypothetical protein
MEPCKHDQGWHQPGPDLGRWTTRMLWGLREAYGREVDACHKSKRDPDAELLGRIEAAMEYLYTRQPPKVGKKRTRRIKQRPMMEKIVQKVTDVLNEPEHPEPK